MSWSIFKANILRYANRPESIDDIDFVASLYANEYDSAVKRGTDSINLIGIQSGNKSIMENLFKLALTQGRLSSSSSFNLIGEFGKGVVAYWAGAPMKPFPIPLIPAPGSIQNIAVTNNTVINPGSWPSIPSPPPNNNASLFVDMFVNAATLHLLSVSGLISTTSLYPGAPTPIPGPGVIVWTGYSVIG